MRRKGALHLCAHLADSLYETSLMTSHSTKASRSQSNHRAYCKRQISANADVTVDQRIDFWGRLPMVVEDETVFALFRDGEATIPFSEDRNLTVTDLEALSAEPYSSDLISHPSFMELWDEALHAALWGHNTRIYLVNLELEIARCRCIPPLDISNQRQAQFNTLVRRWEKLWGNRLCFAKAKDWPSEVLTLFHIRWTARCILWAVLDLKALENGPTMLADLLNDRLLNVLTTVA